MLTFRNPLDNWDLARFLHLSTDQEFLPQLKGHELLLAFHLLKDHLFFDVSKNKL